MYTPTTSAASGGIFTWPARAEAWLDSKGKGAWIAAMVLAFIFVWPVGLAVLGYMLYANKFSGKGCRARSKDMMFSQRRGTSGNTAFDAYKAETLRRLEDEQMAFEAFLQRLREAKDKSEFDQFMDDRARKAAEPRPAAMTATDDRAGNY